MFNKTLSHRMCVIDRVCFLERNWDLYTTLDSQVCSNIKFAYYVLFSWCNRYHCCNTETGKAIVYGVQRRIVLCLLSKAQGSGICIYNKILFYYISHLRIFLEDKMSFISPCVVTCQSQCYNKCVRSYRCMQRPL